jgi:hypothetical protein
LFVALVDVPVERAHGLGPRRETCNGTCDFLGALEVVVLHADIPVGCGCDETIRSWGNEHSDWRYELPIRARVSLLLSSGQTGKKRVITYSVILGKRITE